MRSAKTLLKSVKGWGEGDMHDMRATVYVMGWASNPCEPPLLEALANHPGCRKLIFIPLDKAAGRLNRHAIEHDLREANLDDSMRAVRLAEFLRKPAEDAELFGVDLTDILHHRGGPAFGTEQLEARLQEAMQRPVVPVMVNDADIFLSGHGQPQYDAFVIRRHPGLVVMNNPSTSMVADHKGALPHLDEAMQKHTGVSVLPLCRRIHSAAEAKQFMDEHKLDQIVLKEPDSSCGHGIYRVHRDSPDAPIICEVGDITDGVDDYGRETFLLRDENLLDVENPDDGIDLLAMKWLDNSKGDIRAIILNGTVVGAYRRHHGEQTWLCNYAQGGSIHPVDLKRDLSATDRKKLNALAKGLQRLDIHQASVDLLADETGERFLSEINIGNTDDIVEISKHWDAQNAARGHMGFADQIAADILADYRDIWERAAQMADATLKEHEAKAGVAVG